MANKKHVDIIVKDGIRYISVTVALDIIKIKGLEWWRDDVGNQEADRLMKLGGTNGTRGHVFFHEVNEGNVLKVLRKRIEPQMKVIVKNYHEWSFKNIKKVLISEKQFYSKKDRYMGKPDLYCLLNNGKLALIDHKTGTITNKKDKWQACAYKYLLEQNGHKVDEIYILHNCYKTGKMKIIKIPKEKHLQYYRSFMYAKKVYLDFHYN